MADNRDLAALTGNAALDEVTYSGDTAVVQVVRDAEVTGAEGSKTVQPLDKRVVDTDKARRVMVIGDAVESDRVAVVSASGALMVTAGALTDIVDSVDTMSAKLPSVLATDRLKVDGSGVTQPVSAASLPLPAGAATEAELDAQTALLTTIDADTGSIMTAVQLLDDTVAVLGTDLYTEATTKGLTVGAVRRDADTTLVGTTNEIGPLQMDANGRLKVEAFSGETLPVSAASLPLPTGAATEANQTTEIGHLLNTSAATGTVSDAMASVGAAGTVSAKLRRISQSIEDLKTTALVAGSANIGDVDVASIAAGDNNIGNVDVVTLPNVTIGTMAALVAGSAAIGKLAANTGVDIGDVDVTSVIPGTGATNLGKAVDSAGAGTDTGIAMLGLREDALVTITPADGDYARFKMDSLGKQWVNTGISPELHVSKSFNATTTQTGIDVWDPGAGKKIAVVSVVIGTYGTTAARVILWFGDNADTTFTAGTDQVLLAASFAPSATAKPGLVFTPSMPVICNTADRELHVTTDAGISLDITVSGFEFS